MRKLVSTAILMALAAALAMALASTRAEAKGMCYIRCSDLTGCVRCCNGPGGWTCTPA
jgi:hypothetical protein